MHLESAREGLASNVGLGLGGLMHVVAGAAGTVALVLAQLALLPTMLPTRALPTATACIELGRTLALLAAPSSPESRRSA